jgi:hypothetical protein
MAGQWLWISPLSICFLTIFASSLAKAFKLTIFTLSMVRAFELTISTFPISRASSTIPMYAGNRSMAPCKPHLVSKIDAN